MCFHNALTQKPKEVAKYYGVESPDDLYQPMPHGVGFEHPQWPVVSMNEPHRLSLKHWGLIPSWVKQAEQARTASNQNLNARSETVFEKPSFRDGIQHHRCLVPSSGFFEWREMNKVKYPYFIYPSKDSLFTMAGIASHWVNPATGEVLETFSILTTPANSVMSMIHNVKLRMPLLLSNEAASEWMKEYASEDDLLPLFKPAPDDALAYYTVNKNDMKQSASNDTLLPPFIYPELNTLF